MGSAVVTTTLGYALVHRRRVPWLAASSSTPGARVVDGRLLAGAVLFGLGWGLGGFCPGPALVGAATLAPRGLVFLPAFIVGVWLHDRRPAPRPAAAATDG